MTLQASVQHVTHHFIVFPISHVPNKRDFLLGDAKKTQQTSHTTPDLQLEDRICKQNQLFNLVASAQSLSHVWMK